MKTGSKFRPDVEIAESILQNSKFLDSSEIEENAIRLVNFAEKINQKEPALMLLWKSMVFLIMKV